MRQHLPKWPINGCLRLPLIVLALTVLVSIRPGRIHAAVSELSPQRSVTPYADAQPLFALLRQELLPSELRNAMERERQAEWPRWVTRRDAEIRARLLPGYEDAIVNLLFFGTRFTTAPRITYADVPALDPSAGRNADLEQRLDDMVRALEAPGDNGRLRFVRRILDQRHLVLSTRTGREGVRAYLVTLVTRLVGDRRRYDQTVALLKQLDDPSAGIAGRSTLFQDRGLSSDTSLFPDFAVEEALTQIANRRLLPPRSVRRVAVIGPGLDIADKQDGYDFYPQQTIQPFSLVDSLHRVGLAGSDTIVTLTFDVNPRVTEHLAAARLRARSGASYTIQLARNSDENWMPGLVGFWSRFGDRIARPAVAVRPPINAGHVAVRAVQVRPSVVLATIPADLNVVVQRPIFTSPGDRVDLAVATNVLVYYGPFEQSLALTNIVQMLNPGGLFLTNDFVVPVAGMSLAAYTDVPYTDRGDGDRVWWYRKD